MSRVLFVTLFMAAVLAAAAGATDRGTLQITAVKSPITPVCTVGVPCDGPVAGVRIVVRRNGLVIAGTVTDREGRAHVTLRPGRYRVTASYGGGLRPQVESVFARSFAGRTTRIRISFDTGIR